MMIKNRFLKDKQYLTLALSCLIGFNTWSQEGGKSEEKIGLLSGYVLDSLTKMPIEYASVRLYDSADSSVRTGVYTNEKGGIALDEIPLGKYYIKISFSAYETKIIENVVFSKDKPQKNLGSVGLVLDAGLVLDEVKVRGQKDLLLNDIDKKVYDVGSDLSVIGGSATDVLKNVPLVEVDQDGNISLRGDQNVTILIDGRPSSLAGISGQSLLDAFPASSIERIEIVTNPSAKYDPDGTSGIINIVLKKNKLKGINGNMTLSAGTGNELSASASLSVRNAKMNVYGTYSYRYYTGERNFQSHLKRTIADSSFILDQDRGGTDLMLNHTGRFGADFYIKDRNTLGFSITANKEQREREGDLNNSLFNDGGDLEKNWIRYSKDPSSSLSFDFNANYQLEFKEEKGEINFGATTSTGNRLVEGFYDEDYLLVGGNTDTTSSLVQRLSNQGEDWITTLQVDAVRVISKKIKTDFGAKAIISNEGIDTYSETQDPFDRSYYSDSLSNFKYSYNEQIYSVYGNYTQQVKKIKFQLGLRAEHAIQLPNLISKDERYPNEYNNLFPSAFLKYELAKGSEFSFSYGRRINRASSRQLNPFTSYADPFNLRRGNPALKAEFINTLNLGYSLDKKKINLTLGVFLRQNDHVISRVKEFYENGATAVTYANIDKSVSFGPELILNYKPKPWFKNTLSANGNSIKYIDDTPGIDLNNSGFLWTAKYSGQVEFWKKSATIQVNGSYNSPRVTAQGQIRERFVLDLSGNKKFKDGKWILGFRVSDVLDTREFNIIVDQATSYQTLRFKQNTRRFFINVSYRFGKYDLKKSGSDGNGGGGMDF